MERILVVILCFCLLLLSSCTSMNSMDPAPKGSSAVVKLSNNAHYRLLSEDETGMMLSYTYSSYQFFPNPQGLIYEAKSSFVFLSKDLCRQKNKRYGGVDESSFLVSTGRDIWSGNSFVHLKNRVDYLSSEKIDTKTNPKRESKYDIFFKAVVIIKTSRGFGSGVLISNDGLVATNYHVVENDKMPFVQLYDGQVIGGEVIDSDKAMDMALIKIDKKTSYLTLGSIDEIDIGDEVIAIGTPMGLDFSVSKGIISSIRTNDGATLIQTDCAINSGNSGGPLISVSNGKVVGINSFGVSKRISEGLNFAVSVDDLIKRFQIKEQSGN